MIPSTVEINRVLGVPSSKKFVAAIPIGEATELLENEGKRRDWELVERVTEVADFNSGEMLADPVFSVLVRSSVFSVLSPFAKAKITRFLGKQKISKGEPILKRGESPKAFYLILSGTCEVVGQDGTGAEKTIASLREGDCFGEMSILCEEPVSATVRASSEGTLLAMPKTDFLSVLDEYPILHLHFMKLIAARLRKTNFKLIRETVVEGITGQLNSISLAEIVQTIDSSGRNGILQMQSTHGEKGILGFRDGQIQYAQCGELKGDEAVYRFLSWQDGQFKFVQGEFQEEPNITMNSMALLMESCRRIDETKRMQQ